MMANAARDPYWQASVRRESIDNPGLQSAIEDTCSTCHMPMARTAARADGRMGEVFAHTGRAADASVETAQAWDGVSCTVCHQIAADNLGEHESFDGGYVIATGAAPDADVTGGGDRVRYRIDAGDGVTSVSVTARLLFQTIGYRWARNLADYDAFETNRFVGYYEANADGSVMVLAESSADGRR